MSDDASLPDDRGADTGTPHAGGGGSGRPVVTEEHIGDQEIDDAWIFSDDVVHTIELEIPEASRNALEDDPYTYVPADVTIDGERVEQVGVHLRGKIGSFRPLSGKPKFKIDFNQYRTDQRFWGLETLALNNEVVDCSFIKEPISYRVFRAAGVPAPRTGFARLEVDGASYGLYVILEVYDDRFLKRVYARPDGNLYDGKYVWYGGYHYTLLDFGAGVDHMYQLDEGTDVDHDDIRRVSRALTASAGQPGYYATMGEVIDWDEFHREQLAEQWVGQNDGYGLNKNNYWIYFDPGDDLMDILPWDMDYSFLQDYEWGRSWASPYGSLAYWCMADATCQEAQRALVDDVLAAVEAEDLPARVEAMIALIGAEVAADPRRECSDHSVAWYQGLVRSWVAGRSDEMRSFWGVP